MIQEEISRPNEGQTPKTEHAEDFFYALVGDKSLTEINKRRLKTPGTFVFLASLEPDPQRAPATHPSADGNDAQGTFVQAVGQLLAPEELRKLTAFVLEPLDVSSGPLQQNGNPVRLTPNELAWLSLKLCHNMPDPEIIELFNYKGMPSVRKIARSTLGKLLPTHPRVTESAVETMLLKVLARDVIPPRFLLPGHDISDDQWGSLSPTEKSILYQIAGGATTVGEITVDIPDEMAPEDRQDFKESLITNSSKSIMSTFQQPNMRLCTTLFVKRLDSS